MDGMKKNSPRPHWLLTAALAALFLVPLTASGQGAEELKTALLGDAVALVTAGNGIYTISVEESPMAGNCGAWTAQTGSGHPAGAGLNVLFGGGNPGTSWTTLRSYTSGTDYTTSPACTQICGVVAPVVQPILNGASTAGYRLTWTFTDGGNTVELVQEVVVEGPFNGSETVDNTAIRETHIVRNLGPGNLDFGLRKQWDWQIAADDGPFFGSCETPTQACDRSLNLTGDGSQDGLYPVAYVINSDPAVATCPPGVNPGVPGCGGMPPYLVAGTVAPPSNLSPAPDAPELLQFNSWPSLVGTCWEPTLIDNASCGGGDTAIAYFYGLTAMTAETLASGQEKSFTQYVVAGQGGCPGILEPTPAIPTLSPTGLAALVLLLLIAAAVMLILRRKATQ